MSVLRLANLHLAYGHHPLLAGVDLVLERRERVALVGRNGTGKSSLLKILSGAILPDAGERWVADGARIAYLQQEVPEQAEATVFDVVAEGLGEVEAWDRDHRVAALLTSMDLPANQHMAECSGGIRRRALLAQALVGEPDLLLLDEPTNHLDIEAIAALEAALLQYRGAVVFVTHDRALIERLAERIIELDRGRLSSFPGDYRTYLARKAAMLEDEARADARFDKALAEEEVWIRQGIKARRTRNEGRVRRLEQMRGERAARIGPKGQVKLAVERGGESGALVAELEHVSFGHDQPIIRDFSTRISRGDRIGIIGPNGCGKTTLLRILLGEIEPQQGSVKLGTGIEIGYFGQLRETLDPEKTVAYVVGNGADYITMNGSQRHVIGYLRGFLFSAKRAMTPIKALSGGERNRVILARLFTRPSNLLVLDEPTNDLDVETLEVLEDRLAEYTGTLLLVSHDRMFVDSVVTSTLAFEEDGQVRRYPGGYTDWQRQGGKLAVMDFPGETLQPPGGGGRGGAAKAGKQARTKLSYRDQRELDALPGQIETLEKEIKTLEKETTSPKFYNRPWHETVPILDSLKAKQAELDRVTARWLELEEMKNRLASSAG
jgi:ATP-binding cassette subfamily F protein uup